MQGKILIIDDNPVIVELLERKFKKEGYDVSGCVESQRALDQCLRYEPQVIILDILMPEKSGWDVMRELSAEPSTSDIPVIVSTVKNRPEDIEKSREMKAADHIAKPYVFSDLLDKVERLLGSA